MHFKLFPIKYKAISTSCSSGLTQAQKGCTVCLCYCVVSCLSLAASDFPQLGREREEEERSKNVFLLGLTRSHLSI